TAEPDAGLLAGIRVPFGRVFPMHPDVRRDEGAEQPGPDGSLMVGGVALDGAAIAFGAIAHVELSESAQPVVGQQLAFGHREDTAGAVGWHHGVAEREGDHLIGADAAVFELAVDDIVETTGLVVPELFVET